MNSQMVDTGIRVYGFETSSLIVVKETDKALLLAYDEPVKAYSDRRVEKHFWCPKSVWNNDKNMVHVGDNEYCFKIPSFLQVECGDEF